MIFAASIDTEASWLSHWLSHLYCTEHHKAAASERSGMVDERETTSRPSSCVDQRDSRLSTAMTGGGCKPVKEARSRSLEALHKRELRVDLHHSHHHHHHHHHHHRGTAPSSPPSSPPPQRYSPIITTNFCAVINHLKHFRCMTSLIN